MAEDCISVRFDGEDNYWHYCWENTYPALSWTSSNVSTGLRKGQGADARAWRTCQYYLNGLASICNHWEGTVGSGSCGYVSNNTPADPNSPPAEIPTGFNNALCDNLGRREWCSKYESSGSNENLDEWVCAAPNGYLTGLGKRAAGHEAPIVRVLDRSEITGYNDDGSGVGLCDCSGMGRGAPGCAVTEENALMNLPVKCNYYRPYSMGFGATTPRGIESEDAAIAAMDDPLDRRLPLSVEFANHRAQFQKCNYWEEDYGYTFQVYENSIIVLKEQITGTVFDGQGRIIPCKCTNTNANPYNHRISSTTSADFMIGLVQAEDGGLICNGARPECPCYSGKWIHCTKEKMSIGMPVTANQILELRFWVADWESKKLYNRFFEQRPNFQDANTSDIYTFTRWNRKVSTPTMIGKRLNLCFPIPAQEKEFTRESVFVDEPITYAPAYVETGTTTTNQVHFPTLIRNPDFEAVRLLTVNYPYFSDSDIINADTITASCNEDDGDPAALDNAGHLKRNNDILGDSVTVMGNTIRNKKVYAINTTGFPVDALIAEYSAMFTTPPSLQNYITSKLIAAVFEGLLSGTEYYVSGSADSIFGIYVLQPVKLVYNQTNKILIMVDFGDGKWEFRWRTVNSLWCGGVVKQTDYTHTYDGVATNNQPIQIDPAGSAEFKVEALSGCVPAALLPTYSYQSASIINPSRYYSYSIIKAEERAYQLAGGSSKYSDIFWWPMGSSNMVGVEINDTDINYIYGWEFIDAALSPSDEKKQELEKKGLSIAPIPMEEYTFNENDPNSKIDQITVPPNFKLLRPADTDKHRMRFFPRDWHLEVNYEVIKFTNDNVIGSVDEASILAGAGKTDEDLYRPAPYEVSATTVDNVTIDNISRGPVNLMAEFNDTDGRLISTMATKACVNIVRESCRNVDIFYSYNSEGRQYRLEPFVGFCILPTQESNMPDPYKHVETPNCGDHDHSWWSWQGPMWFPFNICRGYDMYDEFTVCNNCQAGYVGPQNDGVATDVNGAPIYVGGGTVLTRNDYRYCGPYKYDAFGDTRGNWAASCDCGCKFWYSDASSATVVFGGYGRIRSEVDFREYEAQGWIKPPFGNDGREYVEKFISHDYIDHIYIDGTGQIATRSEWMPMVMDNTAFFMTFNAFDGNTEDDDYIMEGGSLDSFYYVNQMNLALLSNIEETITKTPSQDEFGNPITQVDKRYRFDELFETHTEQGCSYPLPAYPLGPNSPLTKVVFYYFKEGTDHTWAWQELWADIERDKTFSEEEALGNATDSTTSSGVVIVDLATQMLANSDKLDFISSFERPRYVFGFYKDEHRLICSEGNYSVKYIAPIIDESGNMITEASISINGAYPRTFQIVYGDTYSASNYNSGQVTWLDQGGDTQSSASADEDNIYEKADGNSSEWLHDENALFVGEVSDSISAAQAEGRSVVTSVDFITGDETRKYYNTGIIVNIPKSRLDFLPKDEIKFVYSGEGIFTQEGGSGGSQIITNVTEEYIPQLPTQPNVNGAYVWDKDVLFTYNDVDSPVNFYNIKVIGTWGYDFDPVNQIGVTYVKPAMSINFQYQNGGSGPPRAMNSLPSAPVTYSRGTGDLVVVVSDLHTYTIQSQFLLSPIEMLKDRIIGFNITLENTPAEEGADFHFISIEDIIITTVEYSDIKFEPIKVWERKYKASTFSNTGINLDAYDNLYKQTDDYNAGLYFPFKGAGTQSRLDEEVTGFNKTKSITGGLHFDDDISLEISYDNLHEIEKTAQKELYEYATELDESGETFNYTGVMPYKVATFLSNLGVAWDERNLKVTSQTLNWELHQKVQDFKQYDFWRPGGHQYKWNYDSITRQKCQLFGGTEDVILASYKHIDHQGVGTKLAGPEEVVDPGNSYYSLRFYVQQAKYDRAMILAGGEPEFADKILS